jgi:hypothetical protein
MPLARYETAYGPEGLRRAQVTVRVLWFMCIKAQDRDLV